MIEEEDDEEILEKGVSFKSVIKNLFVIILIICGALIIYLGGTGDMTNWMVGFMIICFATTLMQIQKQPPEPIRQTLTILTCKLCGLTKVRNYEQGDYVFQKIDTCATCNDSMEIKQIYSVKLKRQTEENKKTEQGREKEDTSLPVS